MNHLICPISDEKIPEHLPRITAFFNIILMLSFLISGSPIFIAFLLLDFSLRSAAHHKYSPVHQLSTIASSLLQIKSDYVNKAPKQFAARLGTLFFILILISSLTGFTNTAYVLTIVVLILASVECVLNFCVGCYIYTYLVLPFYKK